MSNPPVNPWFEKGVSAALAHGAFWLWVQVVTVIAFKPVADDGSLAVTLLLLPISQPSALVAMLGVVFLGLILRFGAVGRWFFFLLLAAVNGWILFDQLVYARFFQHFSLELVDADVGTTIFLMAVLSDVGSASLFSFLGFSAVSYYLYRLIWRDDVPRFIGFSTGLLTWLHRPIVHLAFAFVVGVSLMSVLWLPLHGITEHPVVMPIYTALADRTHAWQRPAPVNISALRYGTSTDANDHLKEYLKTAPMALAERPVRRIVWIDIGAIDVPPELFVDIVGQHAGFNRLLSAGIFFDNFYYNRDSSANNALLSRLPNDLKYQSLKLTTNNDQQCVDSDTVTSMINAWWRAQVLSSENALSFLDANVPNHCLSENDVGFLSAIVGQIDQLNRSDGNGADTALIVTGHFARALLAAPLSTSRLRGFSLVALPERIGEAVISSRQSEVDDLIATIGEMMGQKITSGRNMLEADWKSKLLYFVSTGDSSADVSAPTVRDWAVIDGEWKYSAHVWGTGQMLVHADQDPAEDGDLSQLFPKRLRYYDRLLGAWYARKGYQLLAPSAEFEFIDGQWWRPREKNIPGLKTLRVGFIDKVQTVDDFNYTNRFNLREPVMSVVRMVPDTKPIDMMFLWRAPDGYEGRYTMTAQPGWTYSYIIPGYGLPMIPGRWSLFVMDPKSERIYLAEEFWADEDTPLHAEVATVAPTLKQLRVGTFSGAGISPKEEFISTTTLSADQTPVVAMDWEAPQTLSFVNYRWQSPSGQIYMGTHGVRTQWLQTWILMSPQIPRTPGKWRASIYSDDTLIKSQVFDIVDRTVPQ